MLDDLHLTVDRARGRCDYADARRVVSAGERIITHNGEVDSVSVGGSDGIGVRVRVGGAWGFASAREPTAAAAERALERALALAAAQPRASGAPLAPVPPAVGHWEGPCE